MQNDDFIKIENLSYDYEFEDDGEVSRKTALCDVSFNIKRGSFVAVIGPNGSGKSTLAKNLNALILPSSGHIFVDGLDTQEADPIEIRRRVGMVFQNPDNQLVSSVVEDDVAFGPENLGVDPPEIRQRVDDSLNKVSMYQLRKKGPHLLSGGQKQRVAIAGVLAMKSECIVFDEPTAMLDPSGRAEIMSIIEDLHNDGKTVILITHFMEEAAKADRIIVLKDGSLYLDAAPCDLFTGVNAQKLFDAHLELPYAVRLADELRKNGIDIPEDIITEDELAEYLCKLK